MRAQLRRKTRWNSITAREESVKNHRVWWEKQEQVREADRKAKAAREAKENARREEERKKEEVERAVKAAEEKREAAAKEYEERSAKRAEQLPQEARAVSLSVSS